VAHQAPGGTDASQAMEIRQVEVFSPPVPGAPATLPLTATLYLPASGGAPAPGLVVGHGAGSCRASHDDFCRAACARGFVVLALDLRGHGESGGRADGPAELDIVAAAQFLRTLPAVDADRVCYRGSSMGGFYGLKAAREAGFAALALLCPASEQVILDAIEERADHDDEAPGPPFWDTPALRSYFAAQDSLAEAGRSRCPVLLVHARADEVVPFEHSLRLAAALAGSATLLALPGGSHTSAQHDPKVHRVTVDWLLARLDEADVAT